MSKTIHLCIDVRGVLHWGNSELKKALKWITKDDGSCFRDVHELREAFMDELAKGHEVIPFGECSDFDYKTGCRGHECEDLT